MEYVDDDAFINWSVKARTLLVTACGYDSEHYKEFVKIENNSGWTTNYNQLKKLMAVVGAASEDYEGGFVKYPTRSIQDSDPNAQKSFARKVFLVHGRDDGPRETVARFLERLGLKP